jgi:hypothetical protein
LIILEIWGIVFDEFLVELVSGLLMETHKDNGEIDTKYTPPSAVRETKTT